MSFNKTTEQESNYNHLEKMDIGELLANINEEDKTVPFAVEKAIPQIEKLIEQVIEKLKLGGRLFYIGSGTSGRLGVVDASECPPTFGVSHDIVIAIIEGGDKAIRKAVENAEDSLEDGWKDLQAYKISKKDIVIGIAASGTTPYVIEAISRCNENDIINFFVEHGVDENTFIEAFNSMAVESQVKQAELRVREYKPAGAPEVVVNGKYRVDRMRAGGQEEMLAVVDFLINKERVRLNK